VNDGKTRSPFSLKCSFIFSCAGYYNYETAYTPEFKGTKDFTGEIVHPQFWPQIAGAPKTFADKKIVVIGSGATAITLVPNLAKTAKHVTMLQRTPSYIGSAPSEDMWNTFLRKWLPEALAYKITRVKNIFGFVMVYNWCVNNKQAAKDHILGAVKKNFDADFVDKHLTPPYFPWEQRFCLAPDGDFYKCLHENATIVTDRISTFTSTGIELESGETLEADVIVTATGLVLQFMGGVEMSVDGEKFDQSKSFQYKGMMLSGLPNVAQAFGYTNASWTLKCDLTCDYVARLLSFMDANNFKSVTPHAEKGLVPTNVFDLTSGYVLRSASETPLSSEAPWKNYQNWFMDKLSIEADCIDNAALKFTDADGKVTRGTKRSTSLWSLFFKLNGLKIAGVVLAMVFALRRR
jgi:cation diffusion facilitator CzcD-associated flavoprotein CzcO